MKQNKWREGQRKNPERSKSIYIKEDLGQNKKKLYGPAKTYRKYKIKQYKIIDENGNEIIPFDEINKRWTEYSKDLLNVEIKVWEDTGGEYREETDDVQIIPSLD